MPKTIKKYLLLIAVLCAAVVLHGCGGGAGSDSGTGSGSGGSTEPLPPKIMSWAPPSTYSDSTSLNPVTELDSIEVYVNESGTFTEFDAPIAFLRAVDTTSGQVATSFNLANLGPYLSRGVTYRVSLRAVSITGMRSDFSPSASFSF